MKRFLALFLALALLAAGATAALAVETDPAPENPETPGDTVPEDAPITIDGKLPGETINTTWSVYWEAGQHSKGLRIETDLEITACHNNNSNITVNPRLVMGAGKELAFYINNPLNGEEHIGKTEEDIIEITLDDGETYAFNLVITYRGGTYVDQVGNHWDISRFIVGKEVLLSFIIRDPSSITVPPYTIEVEQTTLNDTLLALEDQLLAIGEIHQSGNEFSFTVTPLKAGTEKIQIYHTDSNGHTGGKGYQVEVINEGGHFTPNEFLIKDTSDSPSDNAANSTETVTAILEATAALTDGSGELPKNAVTETTASGESVTAIPVKLYSGSAALSWDTANTLGEGKVALSASVDNGRMQVLLPGGFGQVTEPGRIYYPFDFSNEPQYAEEMKAAVKGEDSRTEAVKAGGNMLLPTTATVTLRTKLEGPVNIYFYDENTQKFTKLATASAKDGAITFATRQMGHMVLTTGTI